MSWAYSYTIGGFDLAALAELAEAVQHSAPRFWGAARGTCTFLDLPAVQRMRDECTAFPALPRRCRSRLSAGPVVDGRSTCTKLS